MPEVPRRPGLRRAPGSATAAARSQLPGVERRQADGQAANGARTRHRLLPGDRRRKRRRRQWRRRQGRIDLDSVVMQTFLLSQAQYVPKMIGVLASKSWLDLSFSCIKKGDSVDFGTLLTLKSFYYKTASYSHNGIRSLTLKNPCYNCTGSLTLKNPCHTVPTPA